MIIQQQSRSNLRMKMKTTLKAVAAAVGLAVAGGAQAAIDTDNGGVFFGGTGAGEVWVSIYDPVAQDTFVWDLNVTANDFRSTVAATPETVYTNAELTNFFNGRDSSLFRWTVAANSAAGTGADSSTWVDYGILSTGDGASGPVEGATQPLGLTAITSVLGGGTTQISDVNTSLGANDTVVITDPSDAGQHANGWGANWGSGTNLTFDAEGNGVTNPLDFYFISADPNDAPGGNIVTYLGNWTLTGESLTFQAVPIPAAAWLLGSALIGLVGVARRRDQEA
jgi:hypothetical protein